MLNTTQLLERLAKEYETTSDHILRGNCQDMADYKSRCSRLRTLEDVRNIALGKDGKSEGSLNKDSGKDN